MVTFLFFLFVAAVVVHFIYEGIILPTIHLHYRFKLFALRDELRRLMVAHREEIDQRAFESIQRSMNNSIAVMQRLMFWNIVAVLVNEKLLKDLEQISSEDQRLILSQPIPEIGDIYMKTGRIMVFVFIANSAMLLMQILPGIALGLFWQQFARFLKSLIFLPDKDLIRALPLTELRACPVARYR